MAYRTIVSSRGRERDEYSDQSWADEELETTDRYGLNREATSDEIPLLFEEVRQTYDIQSEQALQVDLHPPPPEQETEAAFEEAFSRLQNENANNLKGCANCSKQVRVENVASFRKGQHLAMPGQKGRIYNKVTRKLKHPYKHHAIVKNVKSTAGTRVEMELIHFTKENNSIEIFETTETYDLANDEIMIVEYTHSRYTTDEIVRRAESMLPQNAGEKSSFKSYNPFTRNCEHFATWCVVGEGQSLQVGGLRGKIGEGLRKIFGEGSNIAKGILRLLFISSDEIAGAMTRAIQVPEFVLGGASAIYLIYCIVMTVVHIKDYRKGQMCWICCKRKLIDLWATFGVFGVTSAITFVIFHFALPLMGPFGIPLMILLLLLSGLLQWSVPKIRRALQSPFNVDKETVNKLSDLGLGDVVSLRYYGLVHDMILTEVHEENSSSTAGRIRCVHYGLPTLFGTREIMEEYFDVNLEKATLKRYDCRHLLCNPNEKVVSRAKKRVGETKWAMWSNRSDHFCFWAKVRQRPHGVCIEWENGELEPSKSKNLSSLLIRKEEVNLMEDIQVGDVLQHETVGVLSGIRSLDSGYGRVFEIDQIIYDKGWIVRSKTFRINLNKDKVYVKKFHPAHCHPMEKRAIRARGWIDRKGKWWTTDGFIEECIMLNP